MLPHPLTKFEIQKYYQNEPKFNGIYSRNNLPKIKDGAYLINPDEFKSIGTNWTALYVNAENITYFHKFGVEPTRKGFRKFVRNKNTAANLYRIQAYDSIMCEYFWIRFIDFMLKVKILLEYTNLFSPNGYKINDEIILKYF